MFEPELQCRETPWREVGLAEETEPRVACVRAPMAMPTLRIQRDRGTGLCPAVIFFSVRRTETDPTGQCWGARTHAGRREGMEGGRAAGPGEGGANGGLTRGGPGAGIVLRERGGGAARDGGRSWLVLERKKLRSNRRAEHRRQGASDREDDGAHFFLSSRRGSIAAG
jgi:hypothetical protein